jgi:type II secretory pathway pseudopilin PulG
MKRRHLTGLTMAEILTVLIILAILSGLLLSTFNGVKNKAKQTVCASNLHQISIAMTMYKDDNGDYPPGSLIYPGFKPYYPTLLLCPASTREPRGEYDYLQLVSAELVNPDPKYRDCHTLRGTDFPIVVDLNHLSSLESGNAKVGIVARENGSIKTVPFHNVQGRSFGECEKQFGLPFYYDF